MVELVRSFSERFNLIEIAPERPVEEQWREHGIPAVVLPLDHVEGVDFQSPRLQPWLNCCGANRVQPLHAFLEAQTASCTVLNGQRRQGPGRHGCWPLRSPSSHLRGIVADLRLDRRRRARVRRRTRPGATARAASSASRWGPTTCSERCGRPASCWRPPTGITTPPTTRARISRPSASAATCTTIARNIAVASGGRCFAVRQWVTCSEDPISCCDAHKLF